MIPCPSNVGTSTDIPDDLVGLAHLQRNNVVAWVTVDKNYYDAISDTVWCEGMGMCIFPCFWPVLILCAPCIIESTMSTELAIQNTYWVLTTTDVKIIVKSHEGACGGRKGGQVKSIPLDRITNCGISEPDVGGFSTTVPKIYIDTVSSGTRYSNDDGPRHEVIAYGLCGYDWFAAEILARRDALRGQNHHIDPVVAVPVVAYAVMDRGDQAEPVPTVESRLQEIEDLRSRGILSEAEYERNLQEIFTI